MKRLFTLLFFAAGVVMSVAPELGAQNYPDRVDYLWITRPDHDDWLYKTGENAKIEVEFYKYGIPRDAEVKYEIANDMLDADSFGSLKLNSGKGVINIGTRKNPGFRDLRLSVEVDGATYKHHIKVGYGVDQIEPFTQEPKDFTEFWTANMEQSRKFPITYSKEKLEVYSTDKVDCYLVKIMLNSSQCVYGHLFYPKNAQAGKCPVVLCPPGAGIKTIKNPVRHLYYPENGCVRLEIEIHGLDPRIPETTFNEMSVAFNGRENGYLANGVDNRDRYYMKRVYLALVRSLDLLTSLPEWDGKNVVVQGGSQGGALSLIAAGLDPRVTLCIVNHPAMVDMAGYSEKGRTGGYPHFNKIEGFFTPNTINTLAYYDVINFARHITAKVYMTWGYNDNTCPPTTSYAVWNILKGPKESLITPVNEHWTSEATEYGQCLWMLKNLK